MHRTLILIIRKAARQGLRQASKEVVPFYQTIIESCDELSRYYAENGCFTAIRINSPCQDRELPCVIEDRDHNLLGIVKADFSYHSKRIHTDQEKAEVEIFIRLKKEYKLQTLSESC